MWFLLGSPAPAPGMWVKGATRRPAAWFFVRRQTSRMTSNPRAAVALAVAGRDAADFARNFTRDVPTSHPTGERIRNARRLRMLSLVVLDRTVLLELLEGADWQELSDALGIPAEEVERRYRHTWEVWKSNLAADDLDPNLFGDHTTGLPHDPDPMGTAETIDAWLFRHAEPWEDPQPNFRSHFDA